MSVWMGLLLATLPVEGCERHHRGDLVVERPSDVSSCLETVDGDLVLGTGTQRLSLPHLTDVTGRLDITLAGSGHASFPALERVHRGLELELRGGGRVELPRLQLVAGPIGVDLGPDATTAGLPALRRHGAGLWLFGGGQLSGLLPHLETVSGTVYLQPTGELRGVLPALERVGGHLVISNGAHLGFDGLRRLRAVDGGVYVFGGDRLALPELSRVGGALAIRDSRARDLHEVGAKGAKLGALLLRDNRRLEDWPSHLAVPPNRIRVDGSPGLARPQ